MGRARHLRTFAVPGAVDYKAAFGALEGLGTLDLADRRIDELSGGERQLVWIARALASECDVLFLDEPAAGLDFLHQDMILSTIRRLSHDRGMTVVFASHFPQHAIHVADKVLLMHGVEEHAFGVTQAVVNEETLDRLYDFPIRKVELTLDGERATSMVPFFSTPTGRTSGES